MIFVHGNNIEGKINSNYKGKRDDLLEFKHIYYEPFKEAMLKIDFTNPDEDVFIKAAGLFSEYWKKTSEFAKANGFTSQSKFESSALEELSVYLFKDFLSTIPSRPDWEVGFYNKGIFAGVQFEPDGSIEFIKKDVDFCIGMRCANVLGKPMILPLVSVEAKTYLDATMLGEIRSSSRAIKNVCPNSKTYVLMGHKNLKDEHLIAMKQDPSVDEMFSLCGGKGKPVDSKALAEYWKEITDSVRMMFSPNAIPSVGRLLEEQRD